MNVTEKGVNMKINRDKNREFVTFADKQSRLLTRGVHRMERETALQMERQTCGNIRQREQIQYCNWVDQILACEVMTMLVPTTA